jgi:hypothetical protein
MMTLLSCSLPAICRSGSRHKFSKLSQHSKLEVVFVRKLPAAALVGLAAAAIAGTAAAASSRAHVINVPLADGSVARIEYVGDVPPKVSVAPAPLPGDFWSTAVPPMADFDRLFEQLNRQMRQIEQMARVPVGAPGINVASYGNLPPGASSVSVVTTSNGGVTCTRTTEIVSQGPGKPPKVTTNVSGNCAGAPAPARPASPSA